MVFPEGTPAIVKPFAERYRLHRFRVGHAELALRYRAPVVPWESSAPRNSSRPSIRRSASEGCSGFPRFRSPPSPSRFPTRYHIHYGEPLVLHERYPAGRRGRSAGDRRRRRARTVGGAAPPRSRARDARGGVRVKPRNVLVTGASSPLGERLVRRLLEDPRVDRVIAVAGGPSKRRRSIRTPRLRILQVDLRREREVHDLLFGPAREWAIDVICHTSMHRAARDEGRADLRVQRRSGPRDPAARRTPPDDPPTRAALGRRRVPGPARSAGPDRRGPPDQHGREGPAVRARPRRGRPHRVRAHGALEPPDRRAAHGRGARAWHREPALRLPREPRLLPSRGLRSDGQRALGRRTRSRRSGSRSTPTARACSTFPGADSLPLSAAIRKWGRLGLPVPGFSMTPLYRLRSRVTGTDFRYGMNRRRFHYSGILDGTRARAELGFVPSHPVSWPRGMIALVLACSRPPGVALPDTAVATFTEARFVAFGDAGNAKARGLADAVATVCAERGCDFVLYLGDTGYPDGYERADDPDFDTHFQRRSRRSSCRSSSSWGTTTTADGAGPATSGSAPTSCTRSKRARRSGTSRRRRTSSTPVACAFVALDTNRILWGFGEREAEWIDAGRGVGTGAGGGIRPPPLPFGRTSRRCRRIRPARRRREGAGLPRRGGHLLRAVRRCAPLRQGGRLHRRARPRPRVDGASVRDGARRERRRRRYVGARAPDDPAALFASDQPGFLYARATPTRSRERSTISRARSSFQRTAPLAP